MAKDLVLMGMLGAFMLWSGINKRALEFKHRRRKCPSCGYVIKHNSCPCVSNR